MTTIVNGVECRRCTAVAAFAPSAVKLIRRLRGTGPMVMLLGLFGVGVMVATVAAEWPSAPGCPKCAAAAKGGIK